MLEVHNPYAVSAVILREAGAKEPRLPDTASPLEGLNFSPNLRANQISARHKSILGLDPAASEEQLSRGIKLHQHVDKFIKDMQKIVKIRYQYPLIGKLFAPKAELRVPLEYIDSEKEIETIGGKAQLKSAGINFLLLSFNVLTMSHSGSTVAPVVLLFTALVQAPLCVKALIKYSYLKSKIVRTPASLNDIKNSSVKRLLAAVRSHGFYTKYCYDHNCIQIELSNKPQYFPVEKDLNYYEKREF